MTSDDAAWFAVRDQFARNMAEPVGTAAPTAPRRAPVAEVRAVTFDVNRPPQWVYRQLDAQGTAVWAGSKLRTARQAENAANVRLARSTGIPPSGQFPDRRASSPHSDARHSKRHRTRDGPCPAIQGRLSRGRLRDGIRLSGTLESLGRNRVGEITWGNRKFLKLNRRCGNIPAFCGTMPNPPEINDAVGR